MVSQPREPGPADGFHIAVDKAIGDAHKGGVVIGRA